VDRSQHHCGASSFLFAQNCAAACAAFACGEVEDADTVARLRHLDNRATAGDLNVVRVRRYGQNINFHDPPFLSVLAVN
jgi:hypothetical protein